MVHYVYNISDYVPELLNYEFVVTTQLFKPMNMEKVAFPQKRAIFEDKTMKNRKNGKKSGIYPGFVVFKRISVWYFPQESYV